MSQQIIVRFHKNSPNSEYDSYLLPKSFDLFESLKGELGTENILGVPFTSNEEELTEAIEEELGGEPDDEDAYEAFEESIETELGQKGDFFPVSDLLKFLAPYRKYFTNYPDQTFHLAGDRLVVGKVLQADLENLEKELQRNTSGTARFVIF